MEHKSTGQELRQILADILTVRKRLAEMAEDAPQGPLLERIQSACAKLDRIAAEMHLALQAGLAKDLSLHDPRALRRMELAQRYLLDEAIETLGAAIEELKGGSEMELEPVN